MIAYDAASHELHLYCGPRFCVSKSPWPDSVEETESWRSPVTTTSGGDSAMLQLRMCGATGGRSQKFGSNYPCRGRYVNLKLLSWSGPARPDNEPLPPCWLSWVATYWSQNKTCSECCYTEPPSSELKSSSRGLTG